MRLLDYTKNINSQTGEDGVLAKVLETLGTTDKWCVEFGAWDGKHLSNTFDLIQNHGYSAVLIEGSKTRFKDLVNRFTGNSQVYPLNNFVGFTPDDSLDKILGNTPIPKGFDLLSIDIDGNDYHVWNAFSSYDPKVVCIEYNPTVPNDVEFVQPADPAVHQGASLQSLVLLGKRKGYELVAVTDLNAIFVRAEYFPLFGITDNSPRTLRENTSAVTHVFCGYDGTIFIHGHGGLLWHGIKYSTRIRQLPKLFRLYHGDFGKRRSKVFVAYRKILRMLTGT